MGCGRSSAWWALYAVGCCLVGLFVQLIEWLLHEIPLTEVAASPAMIVPFATMVNAATAALTDATATLAEKLEAVGASDVLGPVAAGSNNTLVADRNPREVLQQVGI